MVMIANAGEAILLIRKNGQLLPFYTAAFGYADGWPWSIRNKYLGSVSINQDGLIQQIKSIEIVRPFGQSVLSKIFSVLNSNWRIEVEYEHQTMLLDEVKKIVIHGIDADKKMNYGFFRSMYNKDYVSGINKVSSIKEIFTYLGLTRVIDDFAEDDDSFALLDRL